MIRVLVTVWRWRRLATMLAWREFKVRYAGSALGGVWSVLEPGMQFAVYLTVFSYFLGMRFAPGQGVPSYALFLLSGLVPFWVLQEVMQRAVGLARSNANLVRRTSVPLEVIFVGAQASVFLRHGVAFVILIGVSAVSGAFSLTGVPWILAGILVLFLATFALGLFLVPVGAFLPDVGHVVGTGTMLLFFMSPVLYPLDRLPEAVSRWLVWNPVVGLLEMFRAGLVGSSVVTGHVLFTGAAAAGLALLGGRVFAWRAAQVRDVI